jgi:hypothetical protein
VRARVLLLVVALVATVCGIAGTGAAAADASAPLATPIVSGNQLVDSSTGDVFVPHGANWSSFEYACSQGWGYSVGSATAAAASAMRSWGINIVRIPLNEECWLGLDPADDYGSSSGYRAAVAAWVGILNAHGIVAILDLHWSAPPEERALGQWPMADSQSTTFWTSVASVYAGNPSVMFDLFNEPYSISNGNSYTFQLTWDCWENGGCRAPYVDEDQRPIVGKGSGSYPVVGMSALVAAVRSAGASQPILLGGLDYSNNLSGWLAHEPSDPDHQLVASWHNYDGQNQDCNTTSCWNSTILPVAASVPVMTTEFGETDGKTAWFTSFMDWADANGIGYSPWAWTDATQTSGDDAIYSLYSGNRFTPNAPMGTAYKAHLATLQPIVFRIQPAPMTAPGFPAASALTPLSASVSSAITPEELRQLLESSRRQLRIAPR